LTLFFFGDFDTLDTNFGTFDTFYTKFVTFLYTI
jgi:hypothetical protein